VRETVDIVLLRVGRAAEDAVGVWAAEWGLVIEAEDEERGRRETATGEGEWVWVWTVSEGVVVASRL